MDLLERNGTVLTMRDMPGKDPFGFIRCAGDLPDGFNKKDVYFNQTNVCGPAVKQWDPVRFQLSERNKQKPSAAWVVKKDSEDMWVQIADDARLKYVAHKGSKDRSMNVEITDNQPKNMYQNFSTFTNPAQAEASASSGVQYSSQARTRNPHHAKPIYTKTDNQHTGGAILDDDGSWTTHDSGKRARRTKRDYDRKENGREKGIHQSRDDVLISAFQLRGEIVLLKGDIGFIKPLTNLPEGYKQDKDVHFITEKVSSGHFRLMKGDEIVFTLGKNLDRPSAFNVHLVKCTSRNVTSIQEYISETEIILRSCGSEVERIKDESQARSYVVSLLNCPAVWKCIGYEQRISDEAVANLMSVLLLLEEQSSSLEQNFKNVLSVLSKTHFMNVWKGRLHQFINNETPKGSVRLFTVKKFLLMLMQHLPEKGKAVVHLLRPLVKQSEVGVDFLYDLLTVCTRHGVINIEDMEWNELPSVPEINEFFGSGLEGDTYLRPVKTKGPYESPDDYMDTYFRLLRADCFNALCTGIKQFINGKLDHRDMNVYHSLHLVGVMVNPSDSSGLIVALKVVPHRKVHNWATSSSLMFGNLLCLSAAGTFKDPIWATVVNRDVDLLEKHQIIMVEFCTESNVISDAECLTRLHRASSGGTILMVESPTYYRAYQPVLKALQKIDPENLSFKEQLVSAHMPVLPAFMNDNTTLDGTAVFSGVSSHCTISQFMDDDYARDTTLDASQTMAIRRSLQHNIAIIQGPPGTGKTFLGIKLLQLLLSMSTCPNTPILVLTYKNHALDEFLKDIVTHFPDEVVRVGGRSSEPSLDNCNLSKLKRFHKRSDAIFKEVQTLEKQEKHLQEEIKQIIKGLAAQSTLTVSSFIDNTTELQLRNALLHVDWTKEKIFFPVISTDGKKDKLKVSTNMVKKWVQENTLTKDFLHMYSDLVVAAIKQWIPDKQTIKEVGQASSLLLSSQVKLEDIPESKDEKENDLQDERDIEELERERMSVFAKKNQKFKIEDFTSFGEFKGVFNIELFPAAKELLNNTPTIILESVDDLWKLNAPDRVKLIQLWLLRESEEICSQLKEVLGEYQRVCQARTELENQHKVDIMCSKKVIGMTITGANIHSSLLAKVKPSIVIVEEAAEVLEPQLVAILGNWVQQLILIGDHKQLRPKVENYSLVKKFHFDISMMERLIQNNLPYSTLQMQNRMRPEFADLLLDIYPDLCSNMTRVNKNIAPKCMINSMFFWTHCEWENGGTSVPKSGSRSHTNEEEAQRAVKLTLFFLLQGYKPSKVTILSAYQGQTALIRKKMHAAEENYSALFQQLLDSGTSAKTEGTTDEESHVKVHTIDMYQGDENEIVIVSLVRSNEKNVAGFVKLVNRRCVAQSRAKCCLVIIGNKETVCSGNSSWPSLVTKMDAQGYVGEYIKLCCPNHRKLTVINARNGTDIPLGEFCKIKCISMMTCGIHMCNRLCQPRHSHDVCKEVVEFEFPGCLHPGKRKCYEDENNLRCEKELWMKFTKCGHLRLKQCYQKEKQLPCLESCGQVKPCKHLCKEPCSSLHDHAVCSEIIDFIMPNCKHKVKKNCSSDASSVTCKERVTFSFPKCSHSGWKLCHESPDKILCKEKCPRKIPECKHPCNLTCGVPCDRDKCDECCKIREAEEKRKREREELERKKARQRAKEKLEELKKKSVKQGVFRDELKQEGDTTAEYLEVADKVRKYIQPGHKWYPEVTKIEKVTNFQLLERWLQAKCRIEDPARRSELKFHGTSKDGVEGIIKDGFRLPTKGGMYGTGVYFATDSSKSAQELYTKGSNMLLLCDVLLGKSRTVDKAFPRMDLATMQKDKYDSLFAKRDTNKTGGVLFDEFIVYNPDQALPKYIIHYIKLSLNDALQSGVYTLEKKALASGGGMQKYHIKSEREMDPNNALELHYRFAESQFLRMQTTHVKSINSIDYYINPVLVRKFTTMEDGMKKKYGIQKEGKVILAFHGTNPTNIDSIMKDNLRLDKLSTNTGNKGNFGAGIYFSEFPNVSTGYGKLLLCRVLPGKSYECPGLMIGASLQTGYDSHLFQKDADGRGKELVIFNKDQILPCYVINL